MWETKVKSSIGTQIDDIDVKIKYLLEDLDQLRVEKEILVKDFQETCPHEILKYEEGLRYSSWPHTKYEQGSYKCINCGKSCKEYDRNKVFGYDNQVVKE